MSAFAGKVNAHSKPSLREPPNCMPVERQALINVVFDENFSFHIVSDVALLKNMCADLYTIYELGKTDQIVLEIRGLCDYNDS